MCYMNMQLQTTRWMDIANLYKFQKSGINLWCEECICMCYNYKNTCECDYHKNYGSGNLRRK